MIHLGRIEEIEIANKKSQEAMESERSMCCQKLYETRKVKVSVSAQHGLEKQLAVAECYGLLLDMSLFWAINYKVSCLR